MEPIANGEILASDPSRVAIFQKMSKAEEDRDGETQGHFFSQF